MSSLSISEPGNRSDAPCLILAHGAGAPMDSDFMTAIAELLAERGIRVVRFEFPYMAERRQTGKRRPPDREPVLLDTWRRVVADCGPAQPLFIGGKSMGGRMASLVADELGCAGLVCLGYPFHPPGKPERLRTAHLETLKTPGVIVQGTRDPLGSRQEVAEYTLSPRLSLHWLEDGDHDFKPRVKSGFAHRQHIIAAADAVGGFIVWRCKTKP